jgi:hypothetical protein
VHPNRIELNNLHCYAAKQSRQIAYIISSVKIPVYNLHYNIVSFCNVSKYFLKIMLSRVYMVNYL